MAIIRFGGIVIHCHMLLLSFSCINKISYLIKSIEEEDYIGMIIDHYIKQF